ncbi:ribosome maturation factor RimM [Nafulsella turpanensis]|uniref:ribosome maturation factor RimM n=1 Tax=Nafulsella turpanensis TaxID=1265690 RepID=UPI00034AC3F9|nr:ribosome maturation factor RimM [Nafulsella turpanensis]
MQKEDCYLLGYITKPHGLNGEVAAFLDVDSPEEYREMESVFVDINNKLIPFFIEHLEITPKKSILKFEEVDNIEAAEELAGKELYLPLNALPPLSGKAFYYHEIIGFEVIDEVFGTIGPVREVFSNSSQDLAACDHKGKEVLFPITDELIESVDRDNKRLHVKLPDGLIELYLEE